MNITMQMIDAAVKKATEAGLLPRHARQEDLHINQELMRIVLQSALEAAPGAQTVSGDVDPSITEEEAAMRKRLLLPLGLLQIRRRFA
ncbi:hypothetical protein [Noviherbaspirillum saxi]|uniref:Uncharacterized protein n=1 Tax=Noviherbaspirillum saxi TaxID=2320863 RepID=A0A3A3FSF8_9BURK|nr:hypothetical protein [Noviherbaspirillum saxi]RJF98986.1 hypothetical protein D3871_11040 [Noviherbaspirillum saxi]